MLNRLLLAAATFSFIAGCSSEEHLPTIRGALEIQIDEGRTGFEFENTIPLVSSAQDASPGCAAGGCTITYDAEGSPTAFELWLDRGTNGDVGAGFRSFDLTIGQGEASVVAVVEGALGEASFASAGSASCAVTDLAELAGGGEVALGIDCDLASLSGENARAAADLFLNGCTVLWE
jgi:hypothetical protein